MSFLLAFNAVVKLINFLPVNLFKVILCLAVRGVTSFKPVVVLEELQILDLRVKPIFLKTIFNGLYYVRKCRLESITLLVLASLRFGATVITIFTLPGVKSWNTTSFSAVLISLISISLTFFNIVSI